MDAPVMGSVIGGVGLGYHHQQQPQLHGHGKKGKGKRKGGYGKKSGKDVQHSHQGFYNVPPPPPPPPPYHQEYPQQVVKGKGGKGGKEKAVTAIPQYPPSRIVLLRRIAWSATQGVLYDLGKGFGEVERVIMLRSKNHALLEFTRLEDAVQMVEYYRNTSESVVRMGDHSATVGYCKHQKWVAPEASRTLLASLFDSAHRITECIFISPRVIYQLFAPFGAMEIVIVLPKKASKNRVQALVQFTDSEQASYVKETLQGLPVWFGPNIQFALDLLYAKVANLSHALLPVNTVVIPRQVAVKHQKLIQKYGTLTAAFNKPIEAMTYEELLDFTEWRDIIRAHVVPQAGELQRSFEGVSGAELDSGLQLSMGMAAVHKPIEEDWVAHKGISLAEQQETLQTMEILIHNGGMAATGRTAEKAGSDAGSDKDVGNNNSQAAAYLSAPPPSVVKNDLACSAPAVLSSDLWGVKALITPSDREMVLNPSPGNSLPFGNLPPKRRQPDLGVSLPAPMNFTPTSDGQGLHALAFTAPHYGMDSPGQSGGNVASDEELMT